MMKIAAPNLILGRLFVFMEIRDLLSFLKSLFELACGG